jgi:glutamate/aspartate transport system substrate-binding protein
VKFPATRLLAASLALAAGAACAQDEAPVELTGTLAKVRASGAITIAHRASSIPFSYLSARGEPIGYSIELCRKIVEAIGDVVGREREIKWLPVTSESRIEAIVSGRADLECGSTTDNIERKKQVGFSPTIFVSGTKLMVKEGSPIKSFRDLPGKTVVVTAGTTNEQTLRDLAKKFRLDFRLQVSRDHAESFSQVVDGKADAFATDDVLLYGLIAQNGALQFEATRLFVLSGNRLTCGLGRFPNSLVADRKIDPPVVRGLLLPALLVSIGGLKNSHRSILYAFVARLSTQLEFHTGRSTSAGCALE